jgi:hypothetical protein
MEYKKGDSLSYKILDEEYYSRGYGINYETKTSIIREILYRMENGDLISMKNIQAEVKEPKKDSPK